MTMHHTSIRGVALSSNRMTAAVADSRAVSLTYWTRDLPPFWWREEDAMSLSSALTDLRELAISSERKLHVALLVPLARLRRMELPLLRSEELQMVLSRDAVKLSLGAREAHVADGEYSRGRSSPRPLLAAFASSRVIDAISTAAAASGWELASIRPAASAWLHGLRSHSSRAHSCTQIVASTDEAVEICSLGRDGLVHVRRVPASRASADHIRALLPSSSAPVAFLGTTQWVDARAGALREAGIEIVHVSDAGGREPLAFAATHVAGTGGIDLVPDDVRAERRRRVTRFARAMVAASAMAILAAAAVELYGARRELKSLIAQRMAIRAEVLEAMAVRERSEAAESVATALAGFDAHSPRWSRMMARVAAHLPNEAHLTVFRGNGDTLALEGVAREAASVFSALRGAPGVEAVGAQAPIRRDLKDGRQTTERFTLTARVRHRDVIGRDE